MSDCRDIDLILLKGERRVISQAGGEATDFEKLLRELELIDLTIKRRELT